MSITFNLTHHIGLHLVETDVVHRENATVMIQLMLDTPSGFTPEPSTLSWTQITTVASSVAGAVQIDECIFDIDPGIAQHRRFETSRQYQTFFRPTHHFVLRTAPHNPWI
mmetsp:Transcript_16818/g.46450  ORF Transcript_16818/g.46450 Transcript_16818/m.46450 type:complete len:110 (+) Transcript_16818:313-642(+)